MCKSLITLDLFPESASVTGVIKSKLDCLNISLRYTFLSLDRQVFQEARRTLEPHSLTEDWLTPHLHHAFIWIHSQEQLLIMQGFRK